MIPMMMLMLTLSNMYFSGIVLALSTCPKKEKITFENNFSKSISHHYLEPMVFKELDIVVLLYVSVS